MLQPHDRAHQFKRVIDKLYYFIISLGLLPVCISYIYVPQYEYNILVITQVQGKSKDTGDN